MTERDDDIIEFDFFDEPETEQATQRRPALRPRQSGKPGGGGAQAADLPDPAGRHPAAPADPPDRARDLRRDRARLLGPELPQREPDQRLPRLHGRHEDRRRRLRRDRPRPERAAPDSGGRPAGSDQGDRGPRAAAEPGHEQRRSDRPARAAPRRARRLDRVAPVPLQRAERPGGRVRRARQHAGRHARGERARRAGRAIRRERRDLGRPLRGAFEGRAREAGDQWGRGPELRFPGHARPREPALDDARSGGGCRGRPRAALRRACTEPGSSRSRCSRRTSSSP